MSWVQWLTTRNAMIEMVAEQEILGFYVQVKTGRHEVMLSIKKEICMLIQLFDLCYFR